MEELGLAQFVLGPLVWLRQHTFNWDEKRLCQREQYYIIPVARFEPRMSDATEAKVLDRFHWWPVTELARARERLLPLCRWPRSSRDTLHRGRLVSRWQWRCWLTEVFGSPTAQQRFAADCQEPTLRFGPWQSAANLAFGRNILIMEVCYETPSLCHLGIGACSPVRAKALGSGYPSRFGIEGPRGSTRRCRFGCYTACSALTPLLLPAERNYSECSSLPQLPHREQLSGRPGRPMRTALAHLFLLPGCLQPCC